MLDYKVKTGYNTHYWVIDGKKFTKLVDILHHMEKAGFKMTDIIVFVRDLPVQEDAHDAR